MGVEKI